eukprot:scaffold1361_cov165-Amphora_coffeaeformis.AAC.12
MGSECSKERSVATKSKKKTKRGGAKAPPPPTTQEQQPPRPLLPDSNGSPSRSTRSTRSSRWSSKTLQASNYNMTHERANSSIESASERSRSGTPTGVVGLRNMGNTCYMNSSLQCLAMTIPLTDYFLGDAHRGEINTTNPLGSKGKLVQAFSKLVREIWIDAPSSGVLRPTNFKNELDEFAPQFKGTRQHDAQELLSILLDGIHEDLNRVKNKPYIEYKDCDGRNDAEDAVEAWKNYLLRDKSVIVDIFQGQLRNRLKCLHCGHQNIRFEPVMYLSLPINDSCKSLDDCLRLFLKEERLTKENQWYCSKCKSHRDATKKIDLWILPPILIVHFKRFRTNERGLVASKNNAAVNFPLQEWMVGSYIKNKDGFAPCYDLYAVSNHMGQMGSGHYTAYGLNRLDDQWYEFNDSTTSQIDIDDIQRNKSSAYLLFYNRVRDGDSVHSNGSLEGRAPLIRRQSVSRPDLWPHTQVRDNRYRSFSRTSQRAGSASSSLLDSPLPAKKISGRKLMPPRNERMRMDEKDDSGETEPLSAPSL